MLNRQFILKFLSLFMFLIYADLLHSGQGMSEEEMQKMMELSQKMQECMARIDQSAMEAQAAKAEKIHNQMKALCDAGKRDKAQDLAIDYGKEVSQSKVMKEMQKCSEMAAGMMQQNPMMQDMIADYENQHVCDGI